MPTIVTHGLVAAGLFRLVAGPGERSRAGVWTAAALAMLPDADVVTRRLVERGDALSHRGMTHSLVFAVVVGVVAAFALRRRVTHWGGAAGLAATLAFCTATHGVLDAFTDGGGEIALLWPFSDERFRFSPTSIPVSPITVDPTNARLWGVIAAEAVLLWPLAFAMGTARRPMPWWGRSLVVAALGVSVWAWAAGGEVRSSADGARHDVDVGGEGG